MRDEDVEQIRSMLAQGLDANEAFVCAFYAAWLEGTRVKFKPNEDLRQLVESSIKLDN